MVGGAGDPNSSAWFFLSRKESVFRGFSSPAFAGFLLPKLGFRPKTGLCVSRSGEVGLSCTGEILRRETLLWAAQVGWASGYTKH